MPKMMVLQTRRLRIHGYSEGINILCRQWKGGTPEYPMLDAVFTHKLDVSSSHMAVCRSCEWKQKCVSPTTSEARLVKNKFWTSEDFSLTGSEERLVDVEIVKPATADGEPMVIKDKVNVKSCGRHVERTTTPWRRRACRT